MKFKKFQQHQPNHFGLWMFICKFLLIIQLTGCLLIKVPYLEGTHVCMCIEYAWNVSWISIKHIPGTPFALCIAKQRVETRFPREIRVRSGVLNYWRSHLRIWSYPAVRWIFAAPGSKGLQPESQPAHRLYLSAIAYRDRFTFSRSFAEWPVKNNT